MSSQDLRELQHGQGLVLRVLHDWKLPASVSMDRCKHSGRLGEVVSFGKLLGSMSHVVLNLTKTHMVEFEISVCLRVAKVDR
jgi:hypothetical protein